jgi:hypothetical protein
MFVANPDASAQTLKGLLKSVSSTAAQGSSSSVGSVISSIIGTSASVSLPGTWKYSDLAVSFESDNILSKVSAAALANKVKSSADTYLQKMGIKAGQMTYTFNSDGTFTSTIKTAVKTFNLAGNYATKDNGKTITLKYGKALQYFSMTGSLSGTSKGCAMLFNADSFLNYMKKVGALMGNKGTASAVSGISALASSYKGMNVGFEFGR